MTKDSVSVSRTLEERNAILVVLAITSTPHVKAVTVTYLAAMASHVTTRALNVTADRTS